MVYRHAGQQIKQTDDVGRKMTISPAGFLSFRCLLDRFQNESPFSDAKWKNIRNSVSRLLTSGRAAFAL